MKRNLVSAAVAIAVTGLAGGAHGSGFQLVEQNASGLGNAYAGQAAAAENASTIFWNPAGMTRLPGRQVSVAINAIRPQSEFNDNGLSRSPTGGALSATNTNGGDAGDWAFVPNGYLSWQVGSNWWVGLGVTVPFGLKTEYDSTFIGRFQSQRAEVKTIDINPSIAWKVSDSVSLGGGISYQKANIKLDRSQFVGVEAFTKTDIDDSQWGFNLGALFTLGSGTRIGVTYRSTMDYDLTGTTVITGIPVLGTRVIPVRAQVEFPDTLSWGIAHQLNPQWELLGDITYTRWSNIKSVALTPTATVAGVAVAGVPLDTFQFQFRDTYRVGIGANWAYRENLSFKFGGAYDKSPVTDNFRTAFLPDGDRWWLSVGAKYRMSKQATIDVGYAHLFIEDPAINQLQGVAPTPVNGAFRGNLRGNYDSNVNIFSAQFSYSF